MHAFWAAVLMCRVVGRGAANGHSCMVICALCGSRTWGQSGMHRVRPQENGFLETGRPLLARFWALTPTDMHSSTCLQRACIYVYENVLLVLLVLVACLFRLLECEVHRWKIMNEKMDCRHFAQLYLR